MKLDQAARGRVAEAVAAGEKRTCGEVVVVVERRAGRYGDTIAFVSLAASALIYAAGNYRLFSLQTDEPRWEYSPELALAPLPTLLTWVVGFALFWFLLEWAHPLLRLFVRRTRMSAEAHAAAWRTFGERSVQTTKGGTGILVYVAEFEHTVVVLGDHTVAQKLSQEDWEAVRDAVLEGYRTGNPLDGLVTAIGKACELLSQHFPASTDDEQELPDEPHVGE